MLSFVSLVTVSTLNILQKNKKTELTQRVFHEVLSMDDAAEAIAGK